MHVETSEQTTADQLNLTRIQVIQKVRQTNKAVPEILASSKHDKNTYKKILFIFSLTFAFWRGAMRQHNTAEQFLQTSMNSFSCSLSARERLVPSTTSPCWITWSSFILFRDKSVGFIVVWQSNLNFITNYAVAHPIHKRFSLLDCFKSVIKLINRFLKRQLHVFGTYIKKIVIKLENKKKTKLRLSLRY